MENENEIKINADDEKKENNLKILDNIKIENKNEDKTKEEKPKEIPKKLDIDAMKQRLEIDEDVTLKKRRNTVQTEVIYGSNVKDNLSKFNSPSNEDDSKKETEKKLIPKKIDTEKHLQMMKENAKIPGVPKDKKEIKKLKLEEYMNKMKEDEILRKAQEEVLKIIPKKLSIEDYIKKLNESKKNVTVIKRIIPKKMNVEEILNNMLEKKNSKNISEKKDNLNNKTQQKNDSSSSEMLPNDQELEEERKKIEEVRKSIRDLRTKRQEEIKKKDEEEEERIKRQKEEEERKRIEDEKKKAEEKERERKEKEEKIKNDYLNRINKKEEDLSPYELEVLKQGINYKIEFEAYESSTFRYFDYYYEGRNIKYTFEEIKQISTEPIINLEVTDSGKIVALSHKDFSQITIYKENTYEEEKSIILDCKVNSFKIYKDNIYCALSESNDNILIISLNDFDDRKYLSGHSSPATDLTYTSYGYLVSADIKGDIIVWENNKPKKRINDFNNRINTITEINAKLQTIAILSFNQEQIKFYDLRYSSLQPIETIEDIKGSGLQNNMLKLNKNILAVAGTYLYIIDINSYIVTNKINCVYANDCISTSLTVIDDKGFFFVSQALTNVWFNEIEKGTLGYYEYDFIDDIIPDKNPLIKIASKNHCHELFISSIKKIDSDTIVTGAYDGKIKFWRLKPI